ncbi:glycoside hydrolase superfamily, partial [Thelonectria olida]
MWLPAALGLGLWLICLSAAVTEALSQFERLQLNSRPCPRSCDASKNPNEWSFYHDIQQLAVCNEPLLLDYNLLTSFEDPNTDITIRACTLGNAASTVNYLQDSGYVDPDALGETNFGPGRKRRAVPSNATCGAGPASKSSVKAYLTQWDTSEPSLGNQTDAVVATKSLKESLRGDSNVCKKVVFGYFHGTLVGVYSGSLIDTRKTSEAILQRLMDEMDGDDSTTRKALEMCAQECTSNNIFGAVADASGDFAAVQAIMKSWSEGERVAKTANGHTTTIDKTPVWSFNNVTTSLQGRNLRYINPRAECRSIRVGSGDTCATLATRCGIGATAFKQFNKGTKDLCSTLTPGQPVCCSSGTLPDIRPDPNADGSCSFHEVEPDEGCQTIATSNGLTMDDLLDFNNKTWGWTGCKNLQVGLRVCVSKGRPPMPASVYNAVCGPTVPGTDPPGDDEELADLNPCPLDVCCNIWGQCGTTKDFCIKSKSETGNPGTSKPGENGCISNCGMELVNNDEPPAQYRKIGYFEGWNYKRPCLNMDVLDIDNSYSHIHFAFGEISSDLKVVIKDENQEQWNLFLGAGGDFKPKKILSFGGWDFSNGPETSGRFRKAVAPGNREAFANRVVAFANENNLDGVDFDWEYPGATDIDGSEPGEEKDGENYLQFLKLVREKLPKQRSLSIAAPASYWYLRGFPIKKMAPVLDYIVLMTYDLHGQWDVGRKWAMDGCPAGNCLRSHINSTETHESLVMVTKAGVVSHKIVVGVTSYGRSFKMSDATCRGPQCTFLGERNNSPAQKGRCTDTGGYISNFEILEIIKKGGAIKSWYDSETDSDYLVYNKVEWVAYMTEETKSRRTGDYKNINFGGTSDWALDLQG